MRLTGLVVADEPELWRDLGFVLDGDVAHVGGVSIRLAGRGAGEGIVGWSLDRAVAAPLDGLPAPQPPAAPASAATHPNRVTAVDHVVATTGDLDRTLAALAAAGLEARRIRAVPGGGTRQAFLVLGTALLEVVGPAGDPPRLWGLTVVSADIGETARRWGSRLGPVRDAVQPGQRIATLRRRAGSSLPLAVMTPRG